MPELKWLDSLRTPYANKQKKFKVQERCDASLSLAKSNRNEEAADVVFSNKQEDNTGVKLRRPTYTQCRSLTDIPEDKKEEIISAERKQSALKRFSSADGPRDSLVEGVPRSRLSSRRCAVSATESIPSHDDDTNGGHSGNMPIKRNSFKISSRFIGSLQKHSISKSKAERVAAAAAMATMLTDQSRQEDGSFLCDPCLRQPSDDTIMNKNGETLKNEELFAFLEKVQGARLDEQRCSLHFPLNNNHADIKEVQTPLHPTIDEVVKKGGPYPQVIPPPNGGYWSEGFHHKSHLLKEDPTTLKAHNIQGNSSTVHIEDVYTSYRKYFIGKEHVNFVATDDKYGPLILSLKHEKSSVHGEGFHRIILRSKEKSWTRRFPAEDGATVYSMARSICEDITTDKFFPVVSTNAWQSILQFDEHTLNSAHKFGLVYQKLKQTKEEELFGNREESPALKEFIDFLGDTIQLQGFEGFRGGLDVQNGHTGATSLYAKHADREIMFHVSTMLPFIEGDRQQLQRKRHIGNDVVAIVFQDEETPFVPNMITSHFLHSFIVIQPINPCSENVKYKVSVTCKEDVPSFAPDLPPTAVFEKSDAFREWLYCKLINAERASYKSQEFAKLQSRTRSLIMDELSNDINSSTMSLMGISLTSSSNENIHDASKDSSNGFLDAFRKFARNRSSSVDHTHSPATPRKGGNTAVDGRMQPSPSFSEGKRSSASNIERSSTFDENDKQKAKHKSDSGSLHKVHSVGVLGDDKHMGSNSSIHESPKRGRRHRPQSPCPSCGSFNSFDSDTGMESMASTQTDSWPRTHKTSGDQRGRHAHSGSFGNNNNDLNEMESLKLEINKLRAEKSEWFKTKQELSDTEKELKRLNERDSMQRIEMKKLSEKIRILELATSAIDNEHLV